MVGKAGFHGRSNAECAVDSHEIVVGKVEGERSIVIFPLLAESVCQASKAANLHSHCEVLALHVAGANPGPVGFPHDGFW